jgi:hypothetical protein
LKKNQGIKRKRQKKTIFREVGIHILLIELEKERMRWLDQVKIIKRTRTPGGKLELETK